MYPAAFRYYRASSVADAASALAKWGDEARLLAGGQSLIPLMKHRMVTPSVLVDLNFLPELVGIRPLASGLAVGAMTRHRGIETAPPLGPGYEAMQDAASVIADVQVRDRGTIGGDLAEADPGGDWGPVLLALDAELTVVRRAGSRRLPVRSFFVDAFTTALEHEEILTEIFVPRWEGARVGSAYLAFKRRAGDFAVASVAVALALDGEGAIQQAGIGLGNVGLKPVVASTAAAWLVGKRPEASAVARAKTLLEEALEPVSDLRGSARYKRAVAGELLERAIQAALARCYGERVEIDAYL